MPITRRNVHNKNDRYPPRLPSLISTSCGEFEHAISFAARWPSNGNRDIGEVWISLALPQDFRTAFAMTALFALVLGETSCRFHVVYVGSFCKFAFLVFRLVRPRPQAQVRVSECCQHKSTQSSSQGGTRRATISFGMGGDRLARRISKQEGCAPARKGNS